VTRIRPAALAHGRGRAVSCWPWPVMPCSSARVPRSTTGRRSTRPSTGMGGIDARKPAGDALHAGARGGGSCRSSTRRSPRSLFAAGSGASFATWQVGPGGAHDRAASGGGVPFPGTRRAARRPGPGRRRRFAIAAVGLWLEPVAMTLFFGQINLVLLGPGGGAISRLPDRIKGKGIGNRAGGGGSSSRR